ncbi:MAG: RHS repeat-associated core domain-containing protein [Planctomycetota bacterium]|nr:MAG: RHS repeat-associated core domain-containing protein [Planctomycetota bacterium]REJ94935.1 MAG: RHS repeat-associated core domain-containing protein [Planctomycetota bacterium]
MDRPHGRRGRRCRQRSAGSDVLRLRRFADRAAVDCEEAADLSHRYLWGPAVDQILADESVASLTSEGNVLWPLADNLGTVRDLAEYDDVGDTTSVVNHITYDAFGNVTSETAAAVDHLFGYTGRAFDEATGLQNNLHRWFDPVTGRWASEDPIGFAAGDANLYRYVGNGPTNGVDPTGLDYVTSGGGKVYWQTEEDGYTYNPDRARHEIGSMGQDGVVTLNEEYGGGRRHIDDLRDSADKFWNLFPDISDLDFSDQRWYIRGACDGGDSGLSSVRLMATGAAPRKESHSACVSSQVI